MDTLGWTRMRVSSQRGEAALAMPLPAVLVLVFRGHVDSELAEQVSTEGDRFMPARTGVIVFNDMEGGTGYAPGFRIKMTAFGDRYKERVQAVHVLFRSKLVAMGIAVSNLAMGGVLTPHSNRKTFEQAMRKAGVRTPLRFPSEDDQ